VCRFRVRKGSIYRGFEVLFTANPKKNIGPKFTETSHQTPSFFLLQSLTSSLLLLFFSSKADYFLDPTNCFD
jgi:hypothetical protein